MGTWASHNFGNDTALDWVATFLQAPEKPGLFGLRRNDKQSLLLRTLRQTHNRRGYDLDTSRCEEALAAAEVLSALLKRPRPECPDEITDWLKSSTSDPSPPLLAAATASVRAIRDDSELRECWKEVSPS